MEMPQKFQEKCKTKLKWKSQIFELSANMSENTTRLAKYAPPP